MRSTRRLVLRRERLAVIDGVRLSRVGGATHIATDCGCVTHGYSCDACEVPSLPINGCPTRALSQFFDACQCAITS